MTHLTDKEYQEEMRLEKDQQDNELEYLMDHSNSNNQLEKTVNWDFMDDVLDEWKRR